MLTLILFVSLVASPTVYADGFFLFTKTNLPNYNEVDANNVSQFIDASADIAFLIHGWMDSREVDYYQNFTEILPSRNYSSIIQVDWSTEAALEYTDAVTETRTIGERVSELIVSLNQNGIPLSQFNVIGHSLGGHVAGFTGQGVLNATGSKVGRITGLDPAGPYFDSVPENQRLSEDDAEIVFVIHTDGGDYGYIFPCGTIDIYPNGGVRIQPGCPPNNDEGSIFCSHQRSHDFYIDALVHPETLIGTSCSSYVDFQLGGCNGNFQIDLGAEFSENVTGEFYLNTRGEVPFGEGP